MEEPTFTEIELQPVYAGFGRRLAAWFIDGFVLWLLQVILIAPVLIKLGWIQEIPAQDISDFTDEEKLQYLMTVLPAMMGLLTAMFFAAWLYYAFMESSNYGGTVGKIAIRIYVTDLEGNRISFARASGRYFGKIFSGLTLGIGYVMAAFTKKKQALHDIIAGTLVLRKPLVKS